jgi:hypothetical protein
MGSNVSARAAAVSMLAARGRQRSRDAVLIFKNSAAT